ncbi:hypothetical protein [Halostella salina]|uniref:hypothetical protein n=1 Tax=Halostella salina TaxID=1547897 RepID=UPI000EF7F122|nr:hypothetical protein [Halostella salina]
MDSKPIRERRRRPHEPTTRDLTDLNRRLYATERRLRQVEAALNEVARRSGGVSVSHPCTRCGGSLLVVVDGELRCPACGVRERL